MAISFLCSRQSCTRSKYCKLVFTLYIYSLLIFADSISFRFPRFESNSNILYHGDAVNSVSAIEFNKINYLCRVGLVTYADKVHPSDRSSGLVSDFSTQFSFFIDTNNVSFGYYGHGLTFFIAPAGFEIPPNSDGGFLGILNTITSFSSSNQILFVEFDSFSNVEWDPPYEHVGINNGTITSAKYTRWNASEHSGEIANVWVTYNATTKDLTMLWSYGNLLSGSENSSLSLQIDLMTALPEWVSIGFSAATGQYVERHNLQSWAFSSNLEEKVKSGGNKKAKLMAGLITPFGFLCWKFLI